MVIKDILCSASMRLALEVGFSCKPHRAKAFRASFCDDWKVVRLALVHGAHIEVVKDVELNSEGYIDFNACDGAVTDVPGILLTTSNGDCIPIWSCDPVKRCVGLAHAGWRGTLQGVAAQLIRRMKDAYGCKPEDISVHIGPGIGACCFEVGEDVAHSFLERYPWAEGYCYIGSGGKPSLDLKGINAEILTFEGVGEIEISSRCSCCEEDVFYSYRRCADTSRMLAYIGLRRADEGK